jgi:glucose-6-phosphate isomerase
MRIKYDFNNMMSNVIGDEHGISEEIINTFSGKTKEIDLKLKEKRKRGEIQFFDLPYQKDIVKDINDYADYVSSRFENFVVLGIGGSSLGGIAVHKALNHPYYNLLSKSKRKGRLKLLFLDNIDPDTFTCLSDVIDFKLSCFNFISKSGSTAETNAQFLVIIERLKKMLGNENFKKNVVFTTDEKKGNFRKIANDEGIKSFIIPEGVGGRFSVLTPVGLLPSSVSGIDIEKLLEGAEKMDNICRNPDVWENPAYMNAILHYLLDVEKGKNISVMISYSDALFGMADWYRQLWAESLGKKYSLNGEVVNTGQTPVKALGVTDQHSQLQLYIEGPNDKVITFLGVEKFSSTVEMGFLYKEIEGLSYLSGHSMNELFHAEQIATETALTKNLRPNCSIVLPEINENTLGQVIFMLEVQTAFAGYLYNINPFDQPGVEEGKQFAYGLLGRKGFENKKTEIENRKRKIEKYII